MVECVRMEPVPGNVIEEYQSLTKTIRRCTLLIKFFGILAIVGVVALVASIFLAQEKEIVPFNQAGMGDYTAIDVVSMEESHRDDRYVYFYYATREGDWEGLLRLSEKDAESDAVEALTEGSGEQVRFYATIKETKVSLGIRQEVADAGTEPEKETPFLQTAATIVASAAVAVTFFAAANRSSAKKKQKLLLEKYRMYQMLP